MKRAANFVKVQIVGSNNFCGATRKALLLWQPPVSSTDIRWKFCHLLCGVVRMRTGSVVADATDFGVIRESSAVIQGKNRKKAIKL